MASPQTARWRLKLVGVAAADAVAAGSGLLSPTTEICARSHPRALEINRQIADHAGAFNLFVPGTENLSRQTLQLLREDPLEGASINHLGHLRKQL